MSGVLAIIPALTPSLHILEWVSIWASLTLKMHCVNI